MFEPGLLSSSGAASPSTNISASTPGDDPSSRMRSHGGNRPSLPQTKQCSLCPAKFTRTTHLNRHLRTHTNERLHRCDTCLSEFTRSDLLTRHRRSCGDLLNQNKSRRKSCQSCAESKVKCDLVQPCSKCISRGKECVFLNDPKVSREKKEAAASRRRASNASAKAPSEASSVSCPSSPTSISHDTMFPSSVFPYSIDANSDLSLITETCPSSTLDISPNDLLFHPSSDRSGCPDLSASSATSSSLTMSPRSDVFDVRTDFSYAVGPEMDMLDESLAKIIPHDIAQAFPESSYTLTAHDLSNSSLMAFTFAGQPWLGEDMPTPSVRTHMDSYVGSSVSDSNVAAGSAADHSSALAPASAIHPMTIDIPTKDCSFNEPAEPELQHYLYLFRSTFLSHLPILHASSWSLDGKPPILLRAMQACGALFVKTRAAAEFVLNTLLNTRECLIQEVAKNPTDSDEQFHLILAGLLLQAIGLFHQSIDQRTSSNIYHGMLVMMIRRCGLIGRCTRWVPPDLSRADAPQIEAAWKDWITQEAIKRTLFLAYLHDCCHCVFFSLQPSFFLSELDWCLPTEPALWNAGSAQEWYSLLLQPSLYGDTASRLAGHNMQKALASLGDMHMPTNHPSIILPPFAHFILIHSVLCSVYHTCFESPCISRSASPHLSESVSAFYPLPLETRDGVNNKANTFVLQYTLHNWLQSWLSAPDTPQAEKGVEESRFMQNALPYYWLAQVSLVAFQEGVKTSSGRPDFCSTPEARFRVLGQWLLHIRTFLRSGKQEPTGLWVELMRIADQDGSSASSAPDGLLSFFPDF